MTKTPESSRDGATMDAMPQTPAHAKQRDHLWVLVLIAGFALFDVWESWTQVGNKSGFAHGTGWTLTVIVEAGAGYLLFAWFGAPGPRSRRFAMRAAAALLVLSLIGQGSSVLAADAVPPLWLKVFVKCLPVIVLALIALLIEMRHTDRADAAEAERAQRAAETEAQRAAAAADERTALRAELDAALNAVEPLRADLETARSELARLAAKNEALTRKLESAAPRKRPRKPAPQKTPAGTRSKPAADPATEVPQDFDAQAQALAVIAAEPDISGAKLAERVGMSERWGQTFKKQLAATAAPKGEE